jgi:hypothetical protein
MSANLENAIQEKVRRLSDEQQQQVMAFVEALEPVPRDPHARRFSFVGIARSGNGALSTETESLLDEAADLVKGGVCLNGGAVRHEEMLKA